MKKTHNCDLQSCSLCRGCLPEWLPALQEKRQTFHFEKGEIIFNEGEEVKGIFFLITGKVKVHTRWGRDKSLIVRFVKPGDIFGHRGLGESKYFISATTVESTTVCFIDYDFFLSTIKINHDYAFHLLMFLAEELNESERKMKNMTHMPVKGRIAYCLLKLHKKFGIDNNGTLLIDVSRQDISSYAGTTYETAFRTMSELVDTGTIGFNGKKILLKDITGLQKLYEEMIP